MPNRVVGCCQVQEDITRFQISLKTVLDVCGECCYLDTRAPTATEPCLVLGVTLQDDALEQLRLRRQQTNAGRHC